MGLFILTTSILLQFAAVVLASLIAWSTLRRAWILIATAIGFMGVRRAISLYQAVIEARDVDPAAESVALLISLLMFGGFLGLLRQARDSDSSGKSPVKSILVERHGVGANPGSLAALLAILVILGVSIVSFYSYRSSREALIRGIFASNMSTARMLSAVADSSDGALSHSDRIRLVEDAWLSVSDRIEDSYICIVNSNGDFLSHSKFPSLKGQYAGDRLLDDRTGRHSELMDLVEARTDWVGWYTSESGESQIAAFAYIDSLSSLMGVYVPKGAVERGILLGALPFGVGLALILAIILPGALGVLYRAYGLALQRVGASEARYRAVVDDQTELICRHQLDSTITFVNEACAKYFDTERDALVGKEFLSLIPQPDRLGVREHFATLGRDNPIATHEHGVIAPNGEIRWMRWTNRALLDDAGGVTEFQGTGRDVSERRKAEEALARSEEIVTNSSDMLALVDVNYRYLAVNIAYAKTFEKVPEEMIGRTSMELFGEEAFETMIRPNAERCMTGTQVRFQEWLVCAGDRKRYMDVLYTPYLNENGDVKGFSVSGRDVTDQKALEVAMATANRVLHAIAEAHSNSVQGGDSRSLFRKALDSLLSLSESEYGFIGEVKRSPEGAPSLRTFAISNISWNKTTRAMFDDSLSEGMLFTNLDTLFGTALVTGEVVIANDAPHDPRRGGVPKGHPALNSFLGIPLFSGKELVGLAGVANRAGGYDDELVEELKPFTDTLARIVEERLVESKREQAEIALRISEERYAIAEHATQDGIWDWNFLTGEDYLSPRWKEILGFEDDELPNVESSFFDRVHPDDQALVGKALKRHLEDSERFHLELRMRHKDDTYRWILSRGKAVFDSTGKPVRMVGSITDISERKRADAELAERVARSSAVLEAAGEGIITIDEGGFIENANPAALNIFGYSAAELIGKKADVLIPEPYRSQHDEYLQRYGRTGVARFVNFTDREFAGLRKDGVSFPITLSVSEVRFGDKRLYTGLVRDLTTEFQLREQLVQSQKMEAIGMLAGGIAHDFNNLLTAINGHAELLMRRLSDSPKATADLDVILEGGRRAAALTHQLLAFSRKQVLEPRALNLNEVVETSGALIERLLGENIKLDLIMAEDVGSIMADATQLEQVILNLAINARDAMPGGGRLRIETKHVEACPVFETTQSEEKIGPHVMLSVKDDGVGMDKVTRDRIFDPFYTTKGVGKGTGLGLSTVYGIVKQTGGHIFVDTELGKGSTFRVYFPETAAKHFDAPAKREEAVAENGTERVLLVEDEDMVRRLGLEVLVRAGFVVFEARSAEEALKILEQEPKDIDLLVTDVMLPGMTGRDLADQLKCSTGGPRVLFVSGYSGEHLSNRGMLEAGVELLRKPFGPNDLLRSVRGVLDKQISSRSQGRQADGAHRQRDFSTTKD